VEAIEVDRELAASAVEAVWALANIQHAFERQHGHSNHKRKGVLLFCCCSPHCERDTRSLARSLSASGWRRLLRRRRTAALVNIEPLGS
jgi:hypothetical protein